MTDDNERGVGQILTHQAQWLAGGPSHRNKARLNFFDSAAGFRSNVRNLKSNMRQIETVPIKRIALTLAATVFAFSASVQAEDKKERRDVDPAKLPPAATKAGVTYAGDIKPILEKSCVKCHGEEKPKAKLRLTTLAGALKGAGDEKVIEPGNTVKSPLLANVARLGDDEDSWMPPKNNKAKIAPLTREEIGLIRAWIEQGAK
jgi:uncharacterized membrane protein